MTETYIINEATCMNCGTPSRIGCHCYARNQEEESTMTECTRPIDNKKPEPLGLPDWESFFSHDSDAQEALQPQSSSIVVNRGGPQPAGGMLGLPEWEF